MADGSEGTATISPCGTWRYDLTRRWAPGGTTCVFVCLNPSTADAEQDDPTVRRCVRFARDWGHHQFVMLNAYAFRATEPKVMQRAADPIGPENDAYLRAWAERSAMVVAAWGAHIDRFRQMQLRAMFRGRLHYLRLTKQGFPGHPLYLPKTLTPQPWDSPARHRR